MRKQLLVVLALSFVTFAAAAAPQVLATRTPHYDLRVERTVVSPDQIAYDVGVTDLDTGTVILKSHLTGTARAAVNADSTSGDTQVHVRLSYTQNFFSLMFAAVQGKTVIDESRTWWQLEPRTQGTAAADSTTPEGARPHIDAPGAYRVGGDVKAPIVIHRVDPVYPEAARRDRVSGVAIAEVLIGKDGRVKEAIVLRGLPDGLDQAMLDAIRQWEFKPGTKNGEPVDVIFNLTTSFKLDGSAHPATPPPPR